MKEKPKRGFETRSESLMGAIVGIILIFGLVTFLSQNTLTCTCFGFPGILIVGVIVVLMILASARERRKDDE